MLKRHSNLLLAGLLVLLLAVWIVPKMLKWGKKDSTFRSVISDLDSASVSGLLLYPRNDNHAEIRFTRTDSGWTVRKGKITAEADTNAVRGLLNEILRMRPRQLAAKSKDKWNDFQISDSLGSRIKVLGKDGKVMLDLVIGRIGFVQGENTGMNFGKSNVTGLTHVRLYNETEVYAVESFLAMSANQGFDTWRNRMFLQVNKAELKKLTFEYFMPLVDSAGQADSGFTAELKDSVWWAAGQQADSAKMDNYLNTLVNSYTQDFADDFKPGNPPVAKLTIEGPASGPVVITSYKGKSEGQVILNSSLNPRTYFDGSRSGLADRIFISRTGLLPERKK